MCDSHTVKLLLESAQLLCTTHRLCNTGLPEFLYKLTHKNHPCTKWVRESIQNYLWLCKHALALCEEYTYRYGKVHKSQRIIEWCCDNVPSELVDSGLTPFALAMPDQYKTDCPVESYRNYYKYDKAINMHKFNYTKRPMPSWIGDKKNGL
jgi:hypothetical protein